MDTGAILLVIWAGIVPAIVVTGLVVNLAALSIIEGVQTAKMNPKGRPRPKGRR